MSDRWSGIFPVLTIPFLDNGELDEASLRREIDFELELGIDGLVIFGLASEVYKLTESERQRIIAITVDQVRGNVPIIAGTEHTGSEAAAERSYQAQELGVSGVMAYPPTFIKPDPAGVQQYYGLIAEKINIPVMIQDAQSWTQVPLPVDILAELNSKHPNIQYVKIESMPSGPKITRLLEKPGCKLAVFGGYGGLYYPDEMQRGAAGTLIPPAIADVFVKIHRLFHNGKHEEAESLHSELLPLLLLGMASLDTLIEVQKLMFVKAGIFTSSRMRQPHVAMDALQQQNLEALTRKINLRLFRKK